MKFNLKSTILPKQISQRLRNCVLWYPTAVVIIIVREIYNNSEINITWTHELMIQTKYSSNTISTSHSIYSTG